MSWDCAECSGRTGVDSVCHHCGKSLCRQHVVVVADDAFSDTGGPWERTAAHCPGCRSEHHPRARVATGGPAR